MYSPGRTAGERAMFARDRAAYIAGQFKLNRITLDEFHAELDKFRKDLERAFDVHAEDAEEQTANAMESPIVGYRGSEF